MARRIVTMTRLIALLGLSLAPALALAACAEERAAPPRPDPLAADPLAARALHDPLMIDPDLALSTEANAVLTLPVSHALPPLVADEEAALAAREAARLDLLKDGRVPDLPAPSSGRGPAGLAGARTAPAMLEAAGAPAACTRALAEGFRYAAGLPQPARIMPHGMVQQAAGSTGGPCEARVIRYLTPAAGEDALHHHFISARRAGLSADLFERPEGAIRASGAAGDLVVAVRPGPGGLSAVDLVWWRR